MTDERIMHLWDTRVGMPTQRHPLTKDDVLLFARAVAEEAVRQEREQCAQLCQDRAGTVGMFATSSDALAHNNAVFDCAAAIRRRSKDAL